MPAASDGDGIASAVNTALPNTQYLTPTTQHRSSIQIKGGLGPESIAVRNMAWVRISEIC